MTPGEPPQLLTESAPSPLPRALVLTYITGNTTAPRLRIIVFWGHLVVAAIYAFLFLWAGWFVWNIFSQDMDRIRYTYGPGFAMTLIPAKTRFLRTLHEDFLLLVLPPIPLAFTVLLLLCIGPASRGRRGPALAVTLATIPIMGVSALASAFAFCIGLLSAIDPQSHGVAVPAFLLFPLFLLAVLLLKDLLAYAAWAARNPMEEKPKTSFLPKIQKPHAPP